MNNNKMLAGEFTITKPDETAQKILITFCLKDFKLLLKNHSILATKSNQVKDTTIKHRPTNKNTAQDQILVTLL